MLNLLRQTQRDWAASQGLRVDEAGYFARPKENLPWLTPRTRAAFEAADGSEFGRHGERAKIAALHSSSALAVNVFDYWTTHDPEPLATALALPYRIAEIRFEQKFPTGVGPRSPNLDVAIRSADRQLLAIESKFCEPFGSKSKLLQDKYFPEGKGLWQAAGLPDAQKAASSLRITHSFKYIDAVQLLKHMLGLAHCGADWHLLLLWFEPDPDVGREMTDEASSFKQLLGSDGARFSWLSYQQLWSRLQGALHENDREYASYLRRRYFTNAGLTHA